MANIKDRDTTGYEVSRKADGTGTATDPFVPHITAAAGVGAAAMRQRDTSGYEIYLRADGAGTDADPYVPHVVLEGGGGTGGAAGLPPGWVNVKDPPYGALGNGVADDTAAIQAAVNTLKGTGYKGGTVYFPPGQYTCTGSLDLTASGGIVFEGPAGPGSGFAYRPAASLRYTGTGPRFIDMGNSYGTTFRYLGFNYSSASFTGHLFDCQTGIGVAYCVWEHCLLYGWSPTGACPCTANSIINLSGSNKMSIHDCYIGCAAAGIRGAPDNGTGFQTNCVLIDGCTFDSCTISAILNAEQSWTILTNCFEGTSVNGAGTGLKRALYDNHAAGFNIAAGLLFSGNWMGDPSADLVEWINNNLSPWYGAVFQANAFSGAPVSINLAGGGGAIAIGGNNFASTTQDILLPAGKVVNAGYVTGNRFSTNPGIANLDRPNQQFVVFGNFVNAINQNATTDRLPLYGHLILSHNPDNTAPTVAAIAGSGTGATVSVSGSDTAGLVTVTTGTTPPGGNLAQVTYRTSFQFNDNLVATVPHVQLTPANAAAAALQVYANMNSSWTSWFLTSVGTAPAASTTYQWHYLVVG